MKHFFGPHILPILPLILHMVSSTESCSHLVLAPHLLHRLLLGSLAKTTNKHTHDHHHASNPGVKIFEALIEPEELLQDL